MLEDLAEKAICQDQNREREFSGLQGLCNGRCPRNLPVDVVVYTFEYTPEGADLRQALINRGVYMVVPSTETELESCGLNQAFAASKEFCTEVMEGARNHTYISVKDCRYGNCIFHPKSFVYYMEIPRLASEKSRRRQFIEEGNARAESSRG